MSDMPACGWAVCGMPWRNPAPPPVFYQVVDGRLKCVDCLREAAEPTEPRTLPDQHLIRFCRDCGARTEHGKKENIRWGHHAHRCLTCQTMYAFACGCELQKKKTVEVEH